MKSPRILLVDDDADIRETMVTLLSMNDYNVTAVADGHSAIDEVNKGKYNIVITDLMMPVMSGIDVIKNVKGIDSDLQCIVITGYATVSTAVDAMKAGAYDYLMKPFNGSEVLMLLKRVMELQELKAENSQLKRNLHNKYGYENLIGNSEGIQKVCALIEKVAETDSTILILGESGTGKELVARTIHYNSPRKNKPLIPINCGAIPETLLESELFGHEKGAFTGASTTRIGRFELADGGTIFLDEIGDMSPTLQVKLLRVLQQREFERVGGVRTIKVDVRIIAATNIDLENAVNEGKFREDLYYRLNVIPVVVPPLRERIDDIPLLMDHFLKHFNKSKKREIKGFSPEVIDILMTYPWPGNIRELENLVERLVILSSDGTISPDDLPKKFLSHTINSEGALYITLPETGVNLKDVVEEFENNLILQALQKAQGVKNRAAQLLSLNRTTLVEKLKKKKLDYHINA
ncbi:MAG: sigma-54-dependent Fis family transcriptional regulator [Nitrospirae bacterium]|nr:sigma-54-dependent Fis family transcriptional regulator [Nitrospirota bacterium]